MNGFQKPARSGATKTVRFGRVKFGDDAVTCICGWSRPYTDFKRVKTVQKAAEQHIKRKHKGQGIAL